MLACSFAAALESARTFAHVEAVARDLWRAYAAGQVADAEVESVAAEIEATRRRISPKPAAAVAARRVRPPAFRFPPRTRRCVSPDRLASRDRRRRLAYSGPLPPALCAGFTLGQLATLRIVANEVCDHGVCRLSLGEIAARAGVGVTTARNAIRLAEGDGLLLSTQRPQRGARSLTNVVKIISREWRSWIARGPQGGSKKPNPTDTTVISGNPKARPTPSATRPKGSQPPSHRPQTRPDPSPTPPQPRPSENHASESPSPRPQPPEKQVAAVA